MYIDRYDILLTDVKLEYTSAHTNKSFLSLVFIKLFEWYQLFLNFCSKFWKDCYDSKTDFTFHATFDWLLRFKKLFISRIRAHSKNVLVQNEIFLNPTPSNITLYNFFSQYIYIYIHIAMYIFLYVAAKVWKVKNKSFRLFSYSLLHIDAQGLTSHVSKMLFSIW